MYKQIVAVVDTSDNAEQVLARARFLQEVGGGRLSLLHVCDRHVTGYGEETGRHQIADEMHLKQATYPRLKALGEAFDIDKKDTYMLFGRPADVVHEFTCEQGCDMIVVGTHGRSGMRSWLKSTSSAVLHGARCDVCAVWLDEDQS